MDLQWDVEEGRFRVKGAKGAGAVGMGTLQTHWEEENCSAWGSCPRCPALLSVQCADKPSIAQKAEGQRRESARSQGCFPSQRGCWVVTHG